MLGVLATLLLVIATSFIGISLLLAGFLLLLPGFFTDFLGLLLLLPPIQHLLMLRLLPYLRFKCGHGAGGETFEGEYRRHDLPHDRLNDRRDNEK